MPNGGVAHYYDRLHRWNVVADLFGYGGGRRALTVHRRLSDPRAQGRPTSTRVHDILLAHLPPSMRVSAARLTPHGAQDAGLRSRDDDEPVGSWPRVLDAGCGLGGTMLALAAQIDGRFTGITLSAEQAAVASRSATERGLGGRIEVLVQSYDAPPPGPFDLVVAIESLAHSRAPARSVAALAAVLATGGRFVVVDDMPEPGAVGSSDFATFTAGWQSECLWDHASYTKAFRELGLVIVADLDLTSETRPRTLRQIARLERLNRLVTSAIPLAGFRHVMHSHRGGLALERLTRKGLMRYRLIAADRPATKNTLKQPTS